LRCFPDTFALRHLVAGLAVAFFSVCAAADMAVELNNRGVATYNAGQYAESLKLFEQAYAQAPANPALRRNLCNARQAIANDLAKSGDFSGAATHLERALTVDPENPSPWVQLGSYYLRLDMVSDAIAHLERAIELAPSNVDAHDLLGDAYYMDNDIGSAQVQWEWVSRVQPNRPGLARKMEKASREATVETGFRPTGSKHFQLSYSPDIPGRSLRRVLTVLERAYIEIGRNFGGVYCPGPIQVIVYNAQGFSAATNLGDHVGALYDGKIRIPLKDADGNLLVEQDLKARLYHEYTHVVVRFLGGNNVPWWLNEGLAECFSHELSAADLDLLQRAADQDMLFTLADLEGDQLRKLNAETLRLAYAQSHATVRHLWTRFGQARLANMMSALAENTPPEEALRRTFNRTYASLQRDVARSLHGLR
jgi:hypothetical protein